MGKYLTRDCSCTVLTGVGQRRPEECEHGNRFQTEAELKPRQRRRSTLKRTEPDRDWSDAHAKVAEEGCCRICKRTDLKLEAAHILGREHDEPKVNRATGEILKQRYVHPDRIIPACGPFPNGCHGDVDYKRINLLPYLTIEEQIQAVKDAGGLGPAMMYLAPVDHRKEIEASAFKSAAEYVREIEALRGRVAELEAGIAA